MELAKEHRVVVLTDITRRTAIESALESKPLQNIEFVFYRPAWLRKAPLNSITAQTLYSLWQYSLLPFARALNQQRNFDLIIHLTYGTFRHPSFLGLVGPPFVFGPVGGGEDAPWRLKRSLPPKEKGKEIVRSAMNRLARFNPLLWFSLSRASVIFVRTRATAFCLPRPFSDRALVQQEIGIDIKSDGAHTKSKRPPHAPLRALFAGRLLGWKGVHFALRAVHEANARGYPVHLTVVGRGPCRAWLNQLAGQLGISNFVKWIDHIPQEQLFKMYTEHDCFLFPSLHDSGGSVIVEALSFGLPVICLDRGGPAMLVSPKCAVTIHTQNKTEEDVVNDLAGALIDLHSFESKRLEMASAAVKHASQMSWNAVITDAMHKIRQIIEP